jgi:hypothetical protein
MPVMRSRPKKIFLYDLLVSFLVQSLAVAKEPFESYGKSCPEYWAVLTKSFFAKAKPFLGHWWSNCNISVISRFKFYDTLILVKM